MGCRVFEEDSEDTYRIGGVSYDSCKNNHVILLENIGRPGVVHSWKLGPEYLSGRVLKISLKQGLTAAELKIFVTSIYNTFEIYPRRPMGLKYPVFDDTGYAGINTWG